MPMENDAREDDAIVLPQSGLKAKDGALHKSTKKGDLIARHAFIDISKVTLLRKIDPTGPATLIICGGLAAVCKIFIPLAALAWTSCIIFGIIALFSLLKFRKTELRLECSNGTVAYDVLEPPPEAQGFQISLQSMIKEAKNQDRL